MKLQFEPKFESGVGGRRLTWGTLTITLPGPDEPGATDTTVVVDGSFGPEAIEDIERTAKALEEMENR